MRCPWLATILSAVALTACDGRSDPTAPPSANRQAELAVTEASGRVPDNIARSEDAPPSPAQPGKAESPWSESGYRLIGTEPFWGGTVSSDEINYSTPEDQAGQSIAIVPRYEEGREVYSGRLDDSPFILTLTAGPCSDGMSDNLHRFTATLEVNGETRRGCANARP